VPNLTSGVKCHQGGKRGQLSKFHQLLSFQEEIQSNFIEIQTLNLLQILIQNPFQILRSFYKECCSLFKILDHHIFFQFFQALEDHFSIKSRELHLKRNPK
jgi:hypothetical protein